MSLFIDRLKRLGASLSEIEAIVYSDDINKSMNEFYKKTLEEDLFKAKAVVGEIREWKGIKYQKQSDGSWKPLKGQNISNKQLPRFEAEYFGRNYSEYRNKPKEAIEFLLKNRKGQVKSVYNKKGLGKIDIVWGDEKRGLCHIEKRHLKEQDDFSSQEEMASKIAEAIERGKVEKDKKDDLILYKDMRLIISQTVIYDEEDNFRDKRWILTSYDQSKPKEDKIRKSRTYPSSSSIIQDYEHGEVINRYSLEGLFFSERKDTLKKSLKQHLMRAFLNKKDNILR